MVPRQFAAQPAASQSAGIVDGHKRGQILILRAQSVSDPGPKRRKAFHRKAGVHEVFALRMGAGVCRQGVKETEVVHLFSQMRQQAGHHLAAFSPRLKIPERFGNVARGTFKRDSRQTGRLFAVQPRELRLVVKRDQMADRARAVDHRHLLCGQHKKSGTR